MPGSRDWKDYIPAAGEAKVGLQLTGRYGRGGKNMYRGRRFKSRFARRFRNGGRRVWIADPQTCVPPGAVQISSSATVLVTGLSPRLALPTPTALTVPFDQKHRLVGVQGSVIAWRDPAGTETLSSSDASEFSTMQLLWWMWKRVQLTADTLQAESVASNEPFPEGDLPALLQSDSVLNWGWVKLNSPRWTEPRTQLDQVWTNDEAVATTYLSTITNKQYLEGHHPVIVPRPRIPRLGITLGRDEAVCLYVRRLQWSIDDETWHNGPGFQGNAWVQPMLRCRYEL